MVKVKGFWYISGYSLSSKSCTECPKSEKFSLLPVWEACKEKVFFVLVRSSVPGRN
jgi:hypothetical protein